MNGIISHDAVMFLFAKESRSRRPTSTCCLFIHYGTELDKADVHVEYNITSEFHVVW